MTKNEELGIGNNQQQNITGHFNNMTNIGGNLGTQSGKGAENEILGLGDPTTSINIGNSMGGNVMGIGGGVGDDAKDVTYSTKNDQQFAFDKGTTGQTTTTTTTTKNIQYGYGTASSGETGGGGLLM
jgi:hypothetical protein